MYLLYVDETGDSGIRNSPTRYFALSGLVIHELRWWTCLDDLIKFRKQMLRCGLKLREDFSPTATTLKGAISVRLAAR